VHALRGAEVSAPPIDRVRVEALGAVGSRASEFNFEDFTAFSLRSSMINASEASFELGDQTGYGRLLELVSLGARFRIFVNDRLRLTGRVEQSDAQLSADKSMTQSFTVRTKLSDAIVSSAPQSVRTRGVSIRQFLVAVYASVGITEADFDFRGDVSRDLLTGRSSRGKKPPIPLEPLKEDEAKVQPPESVFAAADRLLRRHGLMHWDGPAGKIVVAAPDDKQDPAYVLRCLTGPDAQFNNVLDAQRTQDVSEAPTELGVFGSTRKPGAPLGKASATARNEALIRAGFIRRQTILDEAMGNKGFAERRAQREISTRNRGLERIVATVDGLAFRDGLDPIPWAPDTTVDCLFETLGGALGIYYIEDVQMDRSADRGDITRLSIVRKGTWVL
jgi:hypothetical protein